MDGTRVLRRAPLRGRVADTDVLGLALLVVAAGPALAGGRPPSALGALPIGNRGGCRAQIAGESRQETKTLYFSPIWFKWIPSSLDIAGKREVAIKAKAVEVVTDIVDGKPVKKKIVVLVGADGS